MQVIASQESKQPAAVGFLEDGSERPRELDPQALTRSNAQVGLWALLATLTMLFAGFTSAYLVRRASSDWQAISAPSLLWSNTLVLLLGGATLELARGRQRRQQLRELRVWLWASVGLGLVFLVGQVLAWRQLVASGIYLPSSPHSSFFYMLTATHGLHVLGGIGALLYALVRARQSVVVPGEPNTISLCATYWHFVAWIWLYLFVLLFVWK